jgi:cobyrinic acid a,c-diamide synthase
VTRALVVAGVASGVGKTSLTLGLLAALRRRGLTVQAFKVGPDFIDPGLHAVATGRPSYNLDGWMCGRDAVLATVARQAADADLAVVEGVMGCFDGVDGTSEAGSTAQIAKWLGAPVVLVVDASAQSRSVAATVLGFERFDPALRVAAVVANRVGGETHARWIAEAVRGACRAVPLGALTADSALTLPERHLGLVTAAEGPLTTERLARLADAVERGVDLDRLRALAAPLPEGSERGGGGAAMSRTTIAVARDVAFQFYYAENLQLLSEAGADLVFWSPLADAEPPDADGLYFGGGYPELHARALADNESCRKAVRRIVESGRAVYAECGGLMYLAESLEDADGGVHAMVGVLPARVSMRPPRMTLGYVEAAFVADTPLGPVGAVARGHEFHFSTLTPVPDAVARAYRLTSATGATRAEGYRVGGALISYAHLHFASNPALARGFVDACARGRR